MGHSDCREESECEKKAYFAAFITQIPPTVGMTRRKILFLLVKKHYLHEHYYTKSPNTMPKQHNYYVYMLTNPKKTVLYTGMTNNLIRRLQEHTNAHMEQDFRKFTARYHCYHLVYFEHHKYVLNAIAREKEIKAWRRSKKDALINEVNPEWKFLEYDLGFPFYK
jgi:putative endonuclease